MRRLAFVLLAVGALVACSDEKDPARPPGTVVPGPDTPDAAINSTGTRRPGVIRVAAFNMRRYFDTVCDTGNCASTDFEELPTKAAFDAMTEKLATGIATIDPDVLSIEEIETSKCLDALVAKLASMGKEFPIAHIGEIGSPGSVDVAILARGKLGEIKTHRQTKIPLEGGGTTVFTRELLEVRMTFGATSVVMFGAHFRSKVADDAPRRLAEAKAARIIVGQAATDLPESLVLLGGDLNDTPGSPPINALEADGALVRVAKDVPVESQATLTFQGQKIAIDHIFIGKGQASRYVPMSATAYRDDPTRTGFAGSDHSAIAADFSIE